MPEFPPEFPELEPDFLGLPPKTRTRPLSDGSVVIIGGAFGKIVTSVVNDLIMPTVGMLVGGVNFSDLKLTMKEGVPEKLNEAGEVIEAAVPAVTLNYGNFLQQTFDFLIIAFCIFLMIKGITKLNNMKKQWQNLMQS